MSVSFNLLVASGQRWPSTNRQILARLQPFPLAIDGVFSEKFSSFVCQIDDTVGSWWRVAFRVPGDVDAEQGNRNSMFNAGPVSRGDLSQFSRKLYRKSGQFRGNPTEC